MIIYRTDTRRDYETHRINQSMQDNLSTMSAAAKQDFGMVLKRLNTQLYIMMSFCIPFSALFFLFTARVIAFHYWVVGICWIASSISMLLQTTTNFLFSAARRRARSDTGKPATRESQVAVGSVTLGSGGPTSRTSLVSDPTQPGTLSPLTS